MQKKLFFYALFIGFLSSINGSYYQPQTVLKPTKYQTIKTITETLKDKIEFLNRHPMPTEGRLNLINQIETFVNKIAFENSTNNNSTELSTLKDTISKLIDTLNPFKNNLALQESVKRVTMKLSSLQTEVQLQLYKNDPTARAKFLDAFFKKYEKIPTEPKEEEDAEQPNPTKEIPFDDLITFLSTTGNADLLENYKELSVDDFVKYQKEFDTIRQNLFEKIRTLNTDADKETKEKYETLQTKLAQIQTNAFLNFFSGDIPTNLHSDLQVKKLATAIKLKETIDQKISKVKNRWNITKKLLSFLSHFLAPKTNKSLQKSIDELIKLGKNYQNDTGDTTLKSLQQRVEGVILFVDWKKTEKDENTKIQYTALLLENVFASKEINAHIKEILINKVIEVFISTNNPKAVSSLVDKINAYSTNPDLLHFIKVATLRPEAAASVSSVLEPSSTPDPKNSESPSDGTKESNSKTDDPSNPEGHKSLHSVDQTSSDSQPEETSDSNVSDKLDQLIKKYKTASVTKKPEIIKEIAKMVVDKEIKIQELQTALETNGFYRSGDVYESIKLEIDQLRENTGNQPRTFPHQNSRQGGQNGTGESNRDDGNRGGSDFRDSEPHGGE